MMMMMMMMSNMHSLGADKPKQGRIPPREGAISFRPLQILFGSDCTGTGAEPILQHADRWPPKLQHIISTANEASVKPHFTSSLRFLSRNGCCWFKFSESHSTCVSLSFKSYNSFLRHSKSGPVKSVITPASQQVTLASALSISLGPASVCRRRGLRGRSRDTCVGSVGRFREGT